MPIEEALEFFAADPARSPGTCSTLVDVGLGYVRLGQPAPTLSGGEAQRVKLASELQKRSTGRTVYVLDEPTTGLHFEDIRKLLGVLQQPGRQGQHGDRHRAQPRRDQDRRLGHRHGSGGRHRRRTVVVATGTPEEVAADAGSHTGAVPAAGARLDRPAPAARSGAGRRPSRRDRRRPTRRRRARSQRPAQGERTAPRGRRRRGSADGRRRQATPDRGPEAAELGRTRHCTSVPARLVATAGVRTSPARCRTGRRQVGRELTARVLLQPPRHRAEPREPSRRCAGGRRVSCAACRAAGAVPTRDAALRSDAASSASAWLPRSASVAAVAPHRRPRAADAACRAPASRPAAVVGSAAPPARRIGHGIAAAAIRNCRQVVVHRSRLEAARSRRSPRSAPTRAAPFGAVAAAAGRSTAACHGSTFSTSDGIGRGRHRLDAGTADRRRRDASS